MQPQSPWQTVPRPYRPRHRRRGGLRLLVVAIIALVAVFVVPTPWAFHIGGGFTPLMEWDGYGAVRASNGGQYVLFAHLQGGIAGEGGQVECSFMGCDNVRGSGLLCGRSGTTYTFDLSGAVRSWWSTDGARTGIDLDNREGQQGPLPDGWVVAWHGVWHGPALALSSPDNSFTEVFTPAGGIRRSTSTADAGTATVTLRPGSPAAFAAACRALASAR